MAREFLETALYERFHSNFIKNVKAIPEDCPLFLSGGVDSATILFAMVELGRKPLCISFNHGELTEDNVVGRSMADHFGLEYHIVNVPTTYSDMLEKTTFIMQNTAKTNKIKMVVQVGIPLIEMVKYTLERGFNYSACGWRSGSLNSVTKKGTLANKRDPNEWKRLKKSKYDGRGHAEYQIEDQILTPIYNFKTLDPYYNDNMRWVMDLDWDQMHKPVQKALLCGYYADLWQNFKLRRQKALQVIGGTRDIMDSLFIPCPTLNSYGYKSIVGIFNRLYEKVNNEV